MRPLIDGRLLAQRFAAVGAPIASDALWCVAGISAGLDVVDKNNAQATRAESAQTVLSISTGHPKTDREPSFGERSSEFKA